MNRKTILMCMMTLLFSATFAQKRGANGQAVQQEKNAVGHSIDFSTIEHLLSLYVMAKIDGHDFNSPLTGILVFYGSLNDVDKKECRRLLVQRMDEYYNAQKKTEALAIADIYSSIAPVNDFGMLKLYYYRGEQAATVEGDTVELKCQIDNIESLSDTGNENKTEYLYVLNGYLEEIRNYIPVDNTINGVWISTVNRPIDCFPFFILKVYTGEDGRPVFELNGKFGYFSYTEIHEDKSVAQEEYVFGTDSIYVIWSNENMRNPSSELNYIFRQTGGNFAAAMGAAAMKDGGTAAGNITNEFVSLGVNLIADEIFAPSKRAYVLQAKMRKINDFQIEADIFSSKLKVRGTNNPKLTEDKWHTIFTKVEPEDSLYWYSCTNCCYPISPFDMSKEEYKVFRKRYKYPKVLVDFNEINMFNKMQINKALYRNEERIMEKGDSLSDIIRVHDRTLKPIIGVSFKDNKETIIKKVFPDYPAYWRGLKKNDIITHVDGFTIETNEQLTRIIERKKPFERVVLTVKRGKKILDISTELYFAKQLNFTNP